MLIFNIMNKYLLSFAGLLVVVNAYGYAPGVAVDEYGVVSVDTAYQQINLDDITVTNQSTYIISNSKIVMDNFADWQNWNPGSVTINSGVSLYITDINTITNGDTVNHISGPISITTSDPNRLYKSRLNTDLTLSVFRETNYENIFNNSRGKFLENIRDKKPNDKMLLAMDKAKNMGKIKSIMNSSYRFKPNILMNPIKTINRALINDMFVNENGTGADVSYIWSDKINNYGARLYLNNKYKDLYFGLGVNLNSFSFHDDFNEFNGFVYGVDIHAKQYLNNFWLNGLFGINRTTFKTDDMYINGNVSSNPSGMSEYGRFDMGYDYTKISDFTISPFVGLILQHYDIMGSSDTDVNLNVGLSGKYDFVMDGIKYEYGANIATDENMNSNVGIKVGFSSVVDKAGAFIKVDAFKDEFDINYKLSINAKIKF